MQAFIPQTDARGCIIPNFIFWNTELSNGSKMLYTLLANYARAKSYCYPSKTTLSKKLKCSINTVKAWLDQLETFGFIKIQQTERSDVYHLFAPIPQEQSKLTVSKNCVDINEKQEQAFLLNNKMYKEENIAKTKEFPSKIDSSLSKIDTEFNIKNLNNIIKTPSIPHEKNLSSPNRSLQETKGWDTKKINQEFEKAWEAYPRKEAKESARNIWFSLYRKGLLPTLEELKSAIYAFCDSFSWQKERGRFIPYFVNFIRGMRWKEREISKKQELPPPVDISSITPPIYQKPKQKTNTYAETQKQKNQAFNIFKSFFISTNKADECYALILFDELYTRNAVPIIHEKQTITSLEFLKNILKR